MNLKSFKIKNFRSIIDSGWCDLSFDNLTGYVGQNESGKSSILQALYAYGQGKIQPEDLRTDDSVPEIACSFQIEEGELLSLLNGNLLPLGALEYIKEKKGRINITAKWNIEEEYFILSLEEKKLADIFRKYEAEQAAKQLINNVSIVVEQPQVDQNISVAEALSLVGEGTENSQAIVEHPAVGPVILTESDFCDTITSNEPDFILFEDGLSLLPNTIDIEDIQNNKTKVDGYLGVRNFLAIADIDLSKLTQKNNAKVKKYIETKNDAITVNFQEFWSQTIGKNNKIAIEFALNHYDSTEEGKAGKPYLEFWINDGKDALHPKQRSEGVRWFLSFYLQMRANALKNNKSGTIFLIDEPGRSLHARAQEDALKVFEDIKDKIKIIYTTHSPYMINQDTIYRIRAVQRTDEDDDFSATRIIGAHHLGSATSNTLAPILDNMGIGFNSQNVIQKDNNILLEEISAFYYLKAFTLLMKLPFNPNYIPATGVSKIPQLAYILMGWGINFIVAVDDDQSGRGIYKDLKTTLCLDNEDNVKKKLYKIKGGSGIEDLFSKTDFKKFVLCNETVTISDSNSAYTKQNGESKPILAGIFYNAVKDGTITIDLLNKQTIDAFQKVLKDLQGMLESQGNVADEMIALLKSNGKHNIVAK